MRVAVIHDVFIEFGGAERVLLAILDMYPDADVYVPLLSPKRAKEIRRHTRGAIRTSRLNDIPLIHSASILLKPFLYLYWELLDLKVYDLVISSSHSFSAKSVITGANTLHVSYIHTPPRYLYTEYNETRVLRNPHMRLILSPLLSWLRTRDYIGGQRPDILVANSRHVRERIAKYYRRDSIVVYPPVRIPASVSRRKPEYFVCVSRLARQKGMELAVRVCTDLSERLVIVGEGSQEKHLRSLAGPTVEFFGHVPDARMASVWAHAKALIYPSIEEDFGIVPVEAMAHGVPVIAYDSGALRESIIDAKTGVFFREYSKQSLSQAIRRFSGMSFSQGALRKQAGKFSGSVFRSRLKGVIHDAFA